MIERSSLHQHALELPSEAILRPFNLYLRWYLRRHFHAIRIANLASLSQQLDASIVYVNHASWWDPLTCMFLARRIFPAHTHFAPMDANALAGYPLLRKLGMFPVEQGALVGGKQFLRVSSQILNMKSSMLWMTPQGAFTDVRRRPVAFKSGLQGLMRRNSGAIAVPLAIEYTFWDDRLPEVLMNVGPAQRFDSSFSAGEIQERLQNAMLSAQDHLAELALTRRAASFDTILSGRSGIGLFYDAWRRISLLKDDSTVTAGRTSGAAGESASKNQGGLLRPPDLKRRNDLPW
jgi:1-acyl-sn-glycerol-3-phosphate acyltransferase